MRFFYAPYSLKKNNKLNSRDQFNTQPGALIKVTDEESWGVADISPKPELGDNSLENEIKNKGPLYQRAVELAQEDLNARREKKSLLLNKPVKNNYLITDFRNLDLNSVQYEKQTVKIKADRNLAELNHFLNNTSADVSIRLDFNSILSIEEFEKFLELLSDKIKNKIEYIEDPTPICEKWKVWNKIIPLAFDFQKTEYKPEFAKYRIIKPSRQKPDISGFYTLTSAMEHPVGLAHGLRIAQSLAQNDSGFLTLDLFEVGDFNKFFEKKENYLNFSKQALNDYGIGMSEELHKIKWIQL